MVLPVAAELNAFHVLGAIFAVWALFVSFTGFRRSNWPSTARGQRLVLVISLVLMLGAVGSAIITAASEEHDTEGHEEKGEPPRGKVPTD